MEIKFPRFVSAIYSELLKAGKAIADKMTAKPLARIILKSMLQREI